MCLSLPCSHHTPIACIVPPYMLRVLTLRGDPATADMARALLRHDEQLRIERAAFASVPPSAQGILPVADPDLCCPGRMRSAITVTDGAEASRVTLSEGQLPPERLDLIDSL